MADDREQEEQAKPLVIDTSVPVPALAMPMKVYGPGVSHAFVLWEHQILAYEKAVSDASTCAGFLFFALGSALSLGISLVTTAMTPYVFFGFFAGLLVSVLACVVFAIQWRRAIRARESARVSMKQHDLPVRASSAQKLTPSS